MFYLQGFIDLDRFSSQISSQISYLVNQAPDIRHHGPAAAVGVFSVPACGGDDGH